MDRSRKGKSSLKIKLEAIQMLKTQPVRYEKLRYSTLDTYFMDAKNWGKLADNNDTDIVDEVSQNLIKLIDTLKEKLSTVKT